jgi:uncharacterized protein involved in propanediol utilization
MTTAATVIVENAAASVHGLQADIADPGETTTTKEVPIVTGTGSAMTDMVADVTGIMSVNEVATVATVVTVATVDAEATDAPSATLDTTMHEEGGVEEQEDKIHFPTADVPRLRRQRERNPPRI